MLGVVLGGQRAGPGSKDQGRHGDGYTDRAAVRRPQVALPALPCRMLAPYDTTLMHVTLTGMALSMCASLWHQTSRRSSRQGAKHKTKVKMTGSAS